MATATVMASTAPHGESGGNGIALPSYRCGGQHPSSPVTAPQYIPYRPSAPCRWSPRPNSRWFFVLDTPENFLGSVGATLTCLSAKKYEQSKWNWQTTAMIATTK